MIEPSASPSVASDVTELREIDGLKRAQLDPQEITRRAATGGVALATRQVASQLINLVGMVFLARLLTPADFGFYAIASFVLSVLQSFGDVGLGASLVRQLDEPTAHEQRTIFTAQFALAMLAGLALLGASSSIADAYRLRDGALLFAVISPCLPLVAIQAMPTIRLERALDFRRIAGIEITQVVTYNAVVIGLALTGAGPLSIAVGITARTAVGAILANVMAPWSWGFALDWPTMKSHLAFGLPYQASSVASLIKWSITPVFVGLLLGPTDVGYIYWGQTVATYAVTALAMLQRLYLPVFAQMQKYPTQLSILVDRVVFATNAVVAPVAILMLVLIDPITRLIYSDKWLPAVPLFYGLWLANLLSATSAPVQGLLNALGLSRVTLAFTLIWMVGTWVLGAPLILALGAMGFVVANAIVQITTFGMFYIAKRHVPMHLLRAAFPGWALAAATGLVVFVADKVFPVMQLGGLLAMGALGLALYGALLLSLYRYQARAALRYFGWTRP